MISVIVCTYNRAARLRNLLASLAALSPPGEAWELLVVDNGSTDATADVAARFAAPAGCRTVYVREPRRGLSHARNRGVRTAAGDIIAFTDDDCVVDRSWLTVLVREFADPGLDLIGGRVELFNPADQPVGIRTGRQRLELGGQVAALSHIPGCNFAARRSVFDRIGGFDPSFGACGVVPSAEDTDFFYRVVARGGRVVYAPDLLVHHDHGRATKAAAAALRRNYAKGRGGFYAKYACALDRRVARLAWREIAGLLRGMLRGGSWAERRYRLRILRALVAGAARVAASKTRPGNEPWLRVIP